MVGFTDADTPPGLGGGYASHLYLRPDSMLMAVPDELDPVTATLFNPLGAGIRWAVEIPDTQPGDVVTILGPGVRGLCAAAPAKEAGAGFVMVTGLGERDAERLALAPAFGADLAVDKVIGGVSRSGIDGYLGIKAVEFEAGRLVCEMPVTDELVTLMGTMHGGCLSAMCDHVLGVVMYPVMPPGYWAATTEFKINRRHRAARQCQVPATGQPPPSSRSTCSPPSPAARASPPPRSSR